MQKASSDWQKPQRKALLTDSLSEVLPANITLFHDLSAFSTRRPSRFFTILFLGFKLFVLIHISIHNREMLELLLMFS